MGRHRLSERLARYRKRKRAGFPVVVSEGDSWFSYEFFPNIIDLIDDREMFAHLRLEMSGDTIENMLTPARIEDLRDTVREEGALFLLFSGGGNDMQNRADELFKPGSQPEECLKNDVVDELFGRLRTNIEDLIEAVGSEAPVVAHGYDYFQPSPQGIRVLGVDIKVGPWFEPGMKKAQIVDPVLQRGIAHLLVRRFNSDLAVLQQTHQNDFVHIDLCNTLTPGDSDDWENEIHPTRRGFRDVTGAFLDQIFSKVRPVVAGRP